MDTYPLPATHGPWASGYLPTHTYPGIFWPPDGYSEWVPTQVLADSPALKTAAVRVLIQVLALPYYC